jgi:hypothetical protein
LRHWHKRYRGAIDHGEIQYLDQDSDLLRLLPRNSEPLRRYLERWDAFAFCCLWRKKQTGPVTPEQQDISYMEDKKIDRFIMLVTIVIWLLMLIAPLWVLHFVNSSLIKLGIITAFIIVFLAVMALVTDAEPSEMLAATAG